MSTEAISRMDNCCGCGGRPGFESVEAAQGFFGHTPFTQAAGTLPETLYLDCEYTKRIWTEDGDGNVVNELSFRCTFKLDEKYGDVYYVQDWDSCIGIRYQKDVSETGEVTLYSNPENTPSSSCYGFTQFGGDKVGIYSPQTTGTIVSPTVWTHTSLVGPDPSGLYAGEAITVTYSNPWTIAECAELARVLLSYIIFPSNLSPSNVYTIRCGHPWPDYYPPLPIRFGLDATPLTADEYASGMRILSCVRLNYTRACTDSGPGRGIFIEGTSCPTNEGIPVARRIYVTQSLTSQFVSDPKILVLLKYARYRTDPQDPAAVYLCEVTKPYDRATDTFPVAQWNCGGGNVRTKEHGTYFFDLPSGQEDHVLFFGPYNPPGSNVPCCNF